MRKPISFEGVNGPCVLTEYFGRASGFNFSHRRAPPVAPATASPAPAAAAQGRSPAPPASPSASTGPTGPKGLAVPRAANNASPTAPAQQQPSNGPKGRKTPVSGQAPSPAPAATNGGGPKIELKPLAGGNGQQHKKGESASTAATSKGAKNGASPAPTASAQSPAPSTSDAAPASASSRKASSSNRQAHPPHTLFVNGLPVPVTEAELREYFAGAAAGIASVRFMFDGKGEQKKFAYASVSPPTTFAPYSLEVPY